MSRILLLSLSLLFATGVHAQTNLKGKIVNQNDYPLSFVNIMVNADNRSGVITDIDGVFELKNIKTGDKLYLSYIGYEALIYEIKEEDIDQELILKMMPTSYELEEVAVVAGVNPAHRIIKKVVANRNQNNPDKYASYRCETYNQMRISTVVDYDKYKNEVIDKREGSPSETQQEYDDRMKNRKRLSQNYHIAIMESVTDKQFIAPNLHKEIILHNKISGLKEPQFVALANDAQPFAFYDGQIEILGETYLSPISKGSTKLYFFEWTDTLITGQDSVFIISYQPKAGKTFEGLKGVLYIHSNQYAIQNVIAEPADETLTSIRIEQKYKYHESDKKWFPEQLSMEWFIKEYIDKYTALRVESKSYIRDVGFELEAKKRTFGREKYIMADDVFELEEEEWSNKRTDKLTTKELNTYKFVDSLSEKHNLEQILNATQPIFNAKVNLGKIDIDLERVLAINDYEKARLGVGLRTSNKLSKKISLGGYGGYGSGDKAFKYGGDVRLEIFKNTTLEGGYFNDLKAPGELEIPIVKLPFSATIQHIYRPVLDNIEELYGELNTPIFRYGTLRIRYAQQQILPNDDYQYTVGSNTFNDFSFDEMSVGLRYAFGEQTVNFMGAELLEPTKFPIFHAKVTYGNWQETGISYQKMIFRVEQKVPIYRLGSIEYAVEAGWLEGDVPWTKLFNSRGLGTGFQPYNLPHTFQTMEQNEFFSDRFVHVFFKYTIGTLTKKSELFQPELSLVHHQAWGSLRNPTAHNQNIKTLENGFLESGIELNNIYRKNYLNLGYFGFGAGIYMRHGAYQEEALMDNLSYRLLGTFAF